MTFPMMNLINWIKKNLLWLVIIALLLWPKLSLLSTSRSSLPAIYKSTGSAGTALMESGDAALRGNDFLPEALPPSDSPDRLVIRDTTISLQVKNVAEAITSIEKTAVSLGGFLIDSYLAKPEFAATGNISVRVPEDKRAEALNLFRSLAVKVVSENVSGRDVTDQFEDLDARLAVLTQTKAKFDNILTNAVAIKDILEVQQEIISLQSQIDNLKGRQKYLSQSAKLTKITLYLSTDDLSLPYAPDKSWRPTVIFRQALRSLIATTRLALGLLIWLVVYSPVILLIWLIYRFLIRRFIRF